MKPKHSMVIVAALMVFAACRGERSTITGTYGAGVVAGQVAVTGLTNNSPAGVEVSIRGTGMTTTLAADGTFTFAEVPENAVLVFHRGDGIDATLELAKSSGFISVSVSPTGATQLSSSSSGRRRSASSGGKETEIEGVVRSASATELVVFTSHQEEVTIALDAQTVIRKGDQTIAAADLTAGTRVHVKVHKVNDVMTATLAIVQNEDAGEPHEAREFEGLVDSASATQLVITDSHGQQDTFVLDASTVIRKGDGAVAATDLKAGDRVHVKANVAADGTMTASLVIVQNTGGDDDHHEAKEYEGIVVSASATQLVITDSHGQQDTFVLDASTVIRKGETTVAASDLEAGDRVHVKATTAADGTSTASLVIVQNTNDDHGGHAEAKEYEGVAASASATELVITDSRNQQLTFVLTATTVIRKGNTAISATDIKIGDRVKVKATVASDGTKTATQVMVQASKR